MVSLPNRLILGALSQTACALFGFFLTLDQAAAHHGTRASYDWSNPTRMRGIVTEFVFRNPHARVFFDVTDEEGNVVNWGLETTSPSRLATWGWSPATLKPGDEIELTVYRSKAGTHLGEASQTEPLLVNGVRLAFGDDRLRASTESTPPLPDVAYDARDFSGVWVNASGSWQSIMDGKPASMTPEGRLKFESHLPSFGPRAVPPALGNDPLGDCNPLGIPRTLLAPPSLGLFEFVRTPDGIIQLFQRGRTWRKIPTDGRELPADPDPRWFGHPVGRWQGDTLIVESTGFDDRTWLDSQGNPHSEAMRLVERWSRPRYDRLELNMTIHDPMIYVDPIVVQTKTYALAPDREADEEFCAPIEEDAFNETIRDPAGGVER